ncbi:UNVERIFIED_ORG: hypothetical protein BCL66_105240 [Martelella mediterranea]
MLPLQENEPRNCSRSRLSSSSRLSSGTLFRRRRRGFDCDEAKQADEIAICADPELAALDSEMAGLWYAYSEIPMLMDGRGAL